MKKTAYVFLADGFEEIEALTPVDMLRRAGVTVTTVGITGKTVTGAHGIAVLADVTGDALLSHPTPSDLPNLLLLPGGMPGAQHLDESPLVDAYVRAQYENGGFLAAICAAPMILGKRGFLRKRRAVCYPGFEDTLLDATVLSEPCVRDGNIITGRAMGAAPAFSCLLVSALLGEDATVTLRAGVIL